MYSQCICIAMTDGFLVWYHHLPELPIMID